MKRTIGSCAGRMNRRATSRAAQRALACAATLLVSQGAYGASASWTGGAGADTNWTNTLNWTATPVPGTGDTATFNNAGVNGNEIIYLNGNTTIAGIIVNNTGTTDIRGGTSIGPVGATQRITFAGGINSGIAVNSGAGAVTIGFTGFAVTPQLNADATFKNDSANPFTISGTITSGGAATAVTLTLSGDGAGGSNAVSGITGVAATPISVIKSGTGAWTLGASTFKGGLTVNSGTLNVVSNSGMAGGTIINNGTVVLGSSNGFGNTAQTLTINGGTITTTTVAGRSIPAVISTVVGGDFSLAGATKDMNFDGPIDLNGGAGGATRIVTVNNGGSTWGGVVSNSGAGAAGLTKAGNSSLTLNNTGNSYNGVTTITAGTLVWGGNNVVPGDLTVTGGTADFGRGSLHNETVANLILDGGTITGSTFSGSILTATSSLDMRSGTVGAPVALAGVGIAVNKTTTGTVTFAGANTYDGGTNISGGVLQIANSGALGSGPVSITGVRLAMANGVSVSNSLSIGTNLGVGGRGLLEANASAVATYSGTIGITDIALGGGHFGTGSGGTLVLSGVITSSVPVSQRNGTVIYSGGGTGYTSLNVTGTGGVGANDGISTAATVNIAVSGANSSLDLRGFNQTLAGLTNNIANAATTTVTNSGGSLSTLTVGNGGVTSTYTGTIQSGTSALALSKIGGGNFVLVGTNAYTGDTNVSGGKLILQSDLTTSANVNVTGGQLQLEHTGTNSRVLKTGAVSASGGTIDVADNKLITTSSVAAVQALVVAGQGTVTLGQPSWNGTSGIITSETAASSSVVTTLAVASNADLGKATFGGVSVGAGDTLVMYTYNGDADLSGKVDADDYFRIDSNYNKSGVSQGFYNGDFNYDGQINGDDYTLIDAAYVGQGSPISAAPVLGGVSAVPEPGSIALLGVSAAGLLRRRRRH